MIPYNVDPETLDIVEAMKRATQALSAGSLLALLEDEAAKPAEKSNEAQTKETK